MRTCAIIHPLHLELETSLANNCQVGKAETKYNQAVNNHALNK